MSAVITLDNLTYEFRGRSGPNLTVLQDVSLEVRSGEFFVLVGPSGCGKSTLLNLISGLSRVQYGQVRIGERTVSGPDLNCGLVFQQYALLPWRTALQNVALGLERKGGLGRRARFEKARDMLRLVGLDAFAERFPHELSGGMKQRVAIARSLAYDPAVLLMDEPFAALDAQSREMLQDELLRIWSETGKTIVFITHSIDEAVYLGQRIGVMSARPGRIKAIVDAPELRDRDGDVRSLPEFIDTRHQIWRLLRDEVTEQSHTQSQIIRRRTSNGR